MLNPFQKAKLHYKKTYYEDKPICDIFNLYEKLVGYAPNRKQTGRAILVPCCFHDDHTPSLALYPDTHSYYCFSCGAHGDIYKMVMELEKVDFKQAIEIIKQTE